MRAKGVRTAKKRIARLMRERGLKGRCKRRFVRTTDSNHEFPIAANVLDRQFDAVAPNLGRRRDVHRDR